MYEYVRLIYVCVCIYTFAYTYMPWIWKCWKYVRIMMAAAFYMDYVRAVRIIHILRMCLIYIHISTQSQIRIVYKRVYLYIHKISNKFDGMIVWYWCLSIL